MVRGRTSGVSDSAFLEKGESADCQPPMRRRQLSQNGALRPAPVRQQPAVPTASNSLGRWSALPAKWSAAPGNPQKAKEVKGDRQRGIVKCFNFHKGYGFIRRDYGPDVFVHCSAILGDGCRYVREGAAVEFEVVTGRKGFRAANVVVQERSELRSPQSGSTKRLPACPDCNGLVRADRLARHRTRVHSKSKGASHRSKRAAGKEWLTSTSTATGFVERDQSRVERRLDATKDIGYPCRESGKYGSHPAHDDFGDEGNA
jgi:cold shock protein